MKILVVLFIYLFFRAKRENPLRIILLVSLKKKKKKKSHSQLRDLGSIPIPLRGNFQGQPFRVLAW